MAGNIEAVALAALLTMLFLTRQYAYPHLRAAETMLTHIGQRQWLVIALIGVLAMGTSVTLAAFGRMPYPRVHDEFSYLLAADTFAKGRLTNPTHPMWVHFESLHIIHQPTYASKYPPAQGLMLAAGQVIGGHPVVGLWMGTGLAAAAVCWMLLAWLPTWWAIVGSLLVALHPGILIYWGQSYMGGTVAMMGGALVFGAMRRIVRRPRTHVAVLLGLGLAVLANSRPYEGLVVSLPVAAVMLAWMISKGGPPFAVSIKRIVLPIAAVLMVTAIAMGYYNVRVSGDVLRLPYLVHEETYATAPFFLWQRPRPEPTYRHQAIQYHHGAALEQYVQQQSLDGFARESRKKIRGLLRFYFGYRDVAPALILPFLLLPWVVRDRWGRFALLTCGVALAGLTVETWTMPHYVAPMTALVCVILLQGMRHLHVWRWRGRPIGRFPVWTIGLVALISFTTTFAQHTQAKPHPWGFGRANLIAQLKGDGMRHLVIVRYGPLYSADHKWAYWEWVYNEADIDSAQVVWAREMNHDQNRRLLEYFSDRKVWLLELDRHDSQPRLVPYPVELAPTVAAGR